MQTHPYRLRKLWPLVALWLLGGGSAMAQTRIALLDFDVRDHTLLPDAPVEQRRRAELLPLLEAALQAPGDIQILHLAAKDIAKPGLAEGYWFDHPDAAAQLGARFPVDYLVVGRFEKPSFLFADLGAHLIDAHSGKLLATPVVQLKGPVGNAELTRRGVEQLAAQLRQHLNTTP